MAEIATERIAEQTAEQARRALASDNALLILAFYQHEAEKLSFIGALRQALHERGVQHQTLDPAHRPDHGTGRLYETLGTVGPQTISLIFDLPHRQEGPGLDPTFLGYFNLHRDRIARERLRMILCLHESDAEQFITQAGDLWDFRHHSYWLGREVAARGTGLWQDVERLTARLPIPQTDQREIKEHVAGVRRLLAGTIESVEQASLLLDVAGWLRRRNASPLAAEVALEGLGIAPETERVLHAELEHELGYALRASGRLPEALAHYETSLQLIREVGNRRGEAITLNGISQIYYAWGRYDEALHSLEESLAIRREIGDRASEAVTLNNIAQVYQSWARYDEALSTLQQSLAISREFGDHRGEAITLNNISQIYDAWGRYDEALGTLQQSLAISRKIGDHHSEAVTLNNIGQIYYAWERYDEALDNLKQSYAICREVGDRAGEATTLNNISQIYHAWGRYDEALGNLEQSLAICREVGDRAGEASTLNNISQIYGAWGRYDESLRSLEQSLAIRREIGDRAGEAVTRRNLAREYARRGELENAITHVRRTVEIDEEIANPDLERDRCFVQELEKRLEESVGAHRQ